MSGWWVQLGVILLKVLLHHQIELIIHSSGPQGLLKRLVSSHCLRARFPERLQLGFLGQRNNKTTIAVT